MPKTSRKFKPPVPARKAFKKQREAEREVAFNATVLTYAGPLRWFERHARDSGI